MTAQYLEKTGVVIARVPGSTVTTNSPVLIPGRPMTVYAHLLDECDPEAHLVQLYGNDDRLLTRNVTRFLAEGLRRGDGLITIASPGHSGSVARQLREERGYSRAVLEGRLVFLDAQTTLDRLVVDGQPRRELFESVVGGAVKEVQERAGHTGVRAYGEMVGLLWKEGEYAAATTLEQMWNALLMSSNIRLFCGYPIDIFSEEFQEERVDSLISAHTHLLPLDDALEDALNRAMAEVLGPRLTEIRVLIEGSQRQWSGAVPRAEAVILWLRNNLSGSAAEILELAREYYQPGGLAQH
jgi:hypothetical protein